MPNVMSMATANSDIQAFRLLIVFCVGHIENATTRLQFLKNIILNLITGFKFYDSLYSLFLLASLVFPPLISVQFVFSARLKQHSKSKKCVLGGDLATYQSVIHAERSYIGYLGHVYVRYQLRLYGKCEEQEL